MSRSIRSKPMAGVERFAPVVLVGALAVALAGCNTTQSAQPAQTTAAPAVAAAGGGADRPWALAWAERYRSNPNDPEAVVNYARALRAYGQRAQAVAVLEQGSIQNPKHRGDRKSTRLNSSHSQISYAVFCLKKKKNKNR